MGGKSHAIKNPGLYDVGYRHEKENPIAPTREIMWAFMGDTKLVYLSKRDLLEQADRLAALAREIKTLVGMWSPEDDADPRMGLQRMLNRVQAEIAAANWETRRQRRRVAQAAIDAKRESMPKFGVERVGDSADGSRA